MPRIKTNELLARIEAQDFDSIRLKGLQGGAFCLLLEGKDGTYLHENLRGELKEYPKADYALRWLKRKTGIKEIIVDIEIWNDDEMP